MDEEGEQTRWLGVRAYAGSVDLLDPGRMRGALELGLALGRVFDAVLLAFEEREEALDLAATVGELGPVGIGVLSVDEGGNLLVDLPPVRHGNPDLRHLRNRWSVGGEVSHGHAHRA